MNKNSLAIYVQLISSVILSVILLDIYTDFGLNKQFIYNGHEADLVSIKRPQRIKDSDKLLNKRNGLRFISYKRP